jgi:hypothetical protein
MTLTHEENLEISNASCLKVDQKFAFVGTKEGLIQGFSLQELKPVTEVLTISTYKINNLETFHDGTKTFLIVALESGQVNIYQST